MRPRLRHRNILGRSHDFVPAEGPVPIITGCVPSLGDIHGGAPLTLTVSGTVTDVTIGGTACTNVVQVNPTTVTCIAPAKSAGSYNVAVVGPGGTSTPLVGAYEAWHPTVTHPAARVYQADRGTTSSGSETDNRVGVYVEDITAGESFPGVDIAHDGIGTVKIATGPFAGRWLQIGGSPGGHALLSVNSVRASDDKGKTWSIILANETGTETRFKRGHTLGVFTHVISGEEYIYVIGDDPLSSTLTGDIWRCPASTGGASGWVRIAQHAWLASRVLFMSCSFNGAIYVLGGQTDINDGNSGTKNCRKSTDGGLTFTDLGDANWPTGRGMVYNPVEFLGELYIVGGGVFDNVTPANNKYYNGVYKLSTSDVWSTALADGHGQFDNTRYNSVCVFNGRIWTINGSLDNATGDTVRAHVSSNGTTWTAPFAQLPWSSTHAQSTYLESDGLYVTEGFQSRRMHVIREHTGQTVSAWNDQGSAAKHLAQATSGKRPILVPNAFGAQPGIAFTGKHFLGMASPDRDRAAGRYETFFVAKSSNFKETASQALNAPCTIVGSSNTSSWNNFGFALKTAPIIDATNASPIVATSDGDHELLTGNVIALQGVSGNRAANGAWTVTVTSPTTFSLNGSSGDGAYTSGGTIYRRVLQYREYSAGVQIHSRGSGLLDDQPRLCGVTHASGDIRLWVGATQQGATITTSTFDTSWTGTDGVGAGFRGDPPVTDEQDGATAVVGAVVILPDGAASDTTFRTKLNLWAKKFGNVAA